MRDCVQVHDRSLNHDVFITLADINRRKRHMTFFLITLAPGGGWEDNTFGYVCRSVCLFVCLSERVTRNVFLRLKLWFALHRGSVVL